MPPTVRPLIAEAVVDVVVDADRVAVAGVRRDLGAAQEQEVGVARLDRGDQRVLRDGVVIGQVHEVEAAALRERHDLDRTSRSASPLCIEWTWKSPLYQRRSVDSTTGANAAFGITGSVALSRHVTSIE